MSHDYPEIEQLRRELDGLAGQLEALRERIEAHARVHEIITDWLTDTGRQSGARRA